ncbi:MAG: SH3 domain-containing protein [Syntrophobacterales bacterium]
METISSLKMFEVLFIALGGMLCIYLGYRLFTIGANQPFDIFSDLKGWRFKIANVAPGIFFAVLGSIVLCSPVITSAIAIFQKETFINKYATKLILDELVEKNKKMRSYQLENDVSLEEARKKLSPAPEDSSPTELRESNKAVVTSHRLRLRKKPGTNYQSIGVLYKGDVITVKETRGAWLRISTDESTDGWVHGNYVRRLQTPETANANKTGFLLSASH